MTERYRPRLTEILDNFQAPDGAKSSIIRRAGLAVAGGGVPVKKVETFIEKSMAENGGLPDWNNIDTAVGNTVNAFYRKLKR